MLTPAQVKPFILNEEWLIRKFAVKYFHDSYLYDEDLLKMVLDGYEKTEDKRKERYALADAENFPQTEETFKRILGFLSESEENKDLLEAMVVSGDTALIKKYLEDIDLDDQDYLPVMDYRLYLSGLSTGALWDELWKHSEDMASEDVDYEDGFLIIDELAKRPDCPLDKVRERLHTHYPENYDGYDEVYLLALAGKLRLKEAIPNLVRNLGHRDDHACDNAMYSLIKIGTKEVVDEIALRFSGESWDFRNYASGVLENIKLPCAERVLLDLISKEQDKTIRVGLAFGLCSLLSAEAVPVVKRIIDEHNNIDNSDVDDLKEALFCNCVMNGIDLPELGEWKKLAYENEDRYLKIIDSVESDWNSYNDEELPDYENDDEFYEDEDEEYYGNEERFEMLESLNSAKGYTLKDMESSTVIRNVFVGRNDPCPCGSGKKYKKCCGK